MTFAKTWIGCAVGLWLSLQDIHLAMSFSSSDMVRLRNDLLGNYSVGVMPLRNQSVSLPVKMSFFLIMIHNLNMKNQVLTASGWLKFEWCDEFLQWSPSEYGGIDELILFQKDVWLPDIFVENTAQHYRELGNNQMLISVKSSGMVHWEPGIITETSCAVNIGKYPFDTQVCDIRFLTWMHTNKTLTVGPEKDKINMDALLPNGEWDITKTEAKEYRYPSTYRMGTDHTGVTFVVHLRRKRFFYVLNTIIPVVMLSCLNVLVFILPSDCGERMALAVTVLLAFTVYLGIISDNIPKTSESLSLLAIYLTSLLALSTASVVCAGIVLNIHYRDPSHPVPRLLKLIFSGIGGCTFPSKASRHSISSADSRRVSICQWERRPVFWDQRRPSVWTKRFAQRGSQRGNIQHADSVYSERDENDSVIEKVQMFTSDSGSPSSRRRRRSSFPSSTPHENIRMRSSHGGSSSSPVSESQEPGNIGEDIQISETAGILGDDLDLPESPPATTGDGGGKNVDLNDTHPCRNPRLAVRQFPPPTPAAEANHQVFRYNFASKKKKFHYNEDTPSVCCSTRGVKFSSDSFEDTLDRPQQQPNNVRDRDSGSQCFEMPKKRTRKASIASQSTYIPERDKYQQYQNNCNDHHYSTMCPELHHLLQDSSNGLKNQTGQHSEDIAEVTWHDIGNSLDRSLFWVFFLFTNTVTVVILVLFVRDD